MSSRLGVQRKDSISDIRGRFTNAKQSFTRQDVDPEDEWEIIGILGSGSFGDVYKACAHKDRTLFVAIKKLFVDGSSNTRETQFALRELELTKHLDSPYLVSFYGNYVYNSSIYIVMEYCGGGCVQDLLDYRRGGLEEARIKEIAFAMMSGVAYLHRSRIVHRDVKPANLLLLEDGTVRLGDFGISQRQEETDRLTTMVGSPFFMSPEQVWNQHTKQGYDNKCDIWASGITTICMADGKPPLSHLNNMEFLYRIGQGQQLTVTHPQKWSSSFIEFIHLMLTRDPRKRPDSFTVLKCDFLRKAESGKIDSEVVLECLHHEDSSSDDTSLSHSASTSAARASNERLSNSALLPKSSSHEGARRASTPVHKTVDLAHVQQSQQQEQQPSAEEKQEVIDWLGTRKDLVEMFQKQMFLDNGYLQYNANEKLNGVSIRDLIKHTGAQQKKHERKAAKERREQRLRKREMAKDNMLRIKAKEKLQKRSKSVVGAAFRESNSEEQSSSSSAKRVCERCGVGKAAALVTMSSGRNMVYCKSCTVKHADEMLLKKTQEQSDSVRLCDRCKKAKVAARVVLSNGSVRKFCKLCAIDQATEDAEIVASPREQEIVEAVVVPRASASEKSRSDRDRRESRKDARMSKKGKERESKKERSLRLQREHNKGSVVQNKGSAVKHKEKDKLNEKDKQEDDAESSSKRGQVARKGSLPQMPPTNKRLSSGSLLKPQIANSWSEDDVVKWLNKVLGTNRFDDIFRDNLINGPMLLTLSETELDLLGIANPLHIRRLLMEISKLKQ